MKKVLALLFAIALSVSMSSIAFAQGDKSACKPMDKMDKPMDKKDDTKAKRHHKYHKKEKKDEMKKDEMKSDQPK
jgi:pentapeptide MXKDX repeat protein